MKDKNKHTYIQLKKKTSQRIKALRLVDRESYDSVVNRLIDWYWGSHPSYKKTEATT